MPVQLLGGGWRTREGQRGEALEVGQGLAGLETKQRRDRALQPLPEVC